MLIQSMFDQSAFFLASNMSRDDNVLPPSGSDLNQVLIESLKRAARERQSIFVPITDKIEDEISSG